VKLIERGDLPGFGDVPDGVVVTQHQRRLLAPIFSRTRARAAQRPVVPFGLNLPWCRTLEHRIYLAVEDRKVFPLGEQHVEEIPQTRIVLTFTSVGRGV